MPVTLSEIARHCGKSVTTVSHVLRGGHQGERYSERTRQKVRQAAEELEYIPNFFAAQIQKQNRRAIMVAFGSFRDPYAAAIASAFEDAAAERGYYIFTTTLGRRRERPLYRIALGANGIRALAVVGYLTRSELTDRALGGYARTGVHVLSIGRPVNHPLVSQVDYDNEAGVESAIDYLIDQGARRIWALGTGRAGPSNVTGLRAQHAVAYGQQRGGQIEARFAEPSSGLDHEAKAEAIADMLADGAVPDAILGCADTWALAAMRALCRRGLKVGSDVAVVGYNDEPHAALVNPPLTTVRIPMTQLGRLGANVLIDQYEGRESPGSRLLLQTELMIRASGVFAPRGRSQTDSRR